MTKGLGECLGLTIEALSNKFSKKKILDQLKKELDQIRVDFRREIKKFNLEGALPEIFGRHFVTKR